VAEEDEPRVIGVHPPSGTQVPPFTNVTMLTHRGPLPDTTPVFTREEIEVRRQRWATVSCWPAFYQLQGKSWYFTITIQQVGNIDAQLLTDDIRIAKLTAEDRALRENSTAEFDAFALASMWVLAGFQLVYTLERSARGVESMKGLGNKIAAVMRDFLKIRSPLAKRREEAGNFPFPYSALRAGGSVCWAVNTSTVVSRLFLSNRLLELVETVAHHVGPHKQWPPPPPA
jgi:hypothetical protein